ncbi:MAG TPA: flagellar export protein FliJ [Burkholderiales bacterium]|nr:flagellar export protein FliJ [Burkholderiales bacterium]
MKDTFRLKVVQNLAQQESESAASRLGVLNAEATKAEAKLNMLLRYREEYRERFRSSMHQDVHSVGFKNFQQFLAKLDEAIEQQRAAVLACQQAVHRGQREWQSKQKQVKAYDALEQRHDNAQAERLKRLDQRLMDDLASRAHTSKN